MKVTARVYFFYSIPFILSVLGAFLFDILSILGNAYNLLLLSIFTVGLPILIFCIPYAIYFFILQRYFKVSFIVSFIAFILTFIGFIIVIIGVQNYYKPIEKIIYFSNNTTIRLEELSLILFEKETGEKGKVNKLETTSRMADWNEGSGTSIQERTFDIEVVPKNSAKDVTHHYIFIHNNGKWILKNK